MFDEPTLQPRRIIRRTVTIITVETWAITFVCESAEPPEEGCLEAQPKHSGMMIEQQELTKPESIHREET